MKVSASIELVWALAGRESVSAGFEYVEPEHFLAAVLKYSELDDSEVQSLAAADAAAPALLPATSTWTSPPIWRDAVRALLVASLIDALSCSAMRRTDIRWLPLP